MVDLTKSEREIALKILDGKSNKEIADSLFVEEKTIKFHITGIYSKTHTKTRSEFISKFFNNRNFMEDKMETLPNNKGYSAPVTKIDQTIDQREKINFIDDKFKIGKAIDQLHNMMTEVTKDDMSAANVNAACNCVTRINETINTAIQAARFLSGR